MCCSRQDLDPDLLSWWAALFQALDESDVKKPSTHIQMEHGHWAALPPLFHTLSIGLKAAWLICWHKDTCPILKDVLRWLIHYTSTIYTRPST